MQQVDDVKGRVDQLAELMEEYRLNEAELTGEGWRVAFRRKTQAKVVHASAETSNDEPEMSASDDGAEVPAAPQGTPVSSPMTGIFYTAPSPSAPPFVKEGESVTAGQVVGLIEAMKVFNEIVAPTSGRVTKIVAQSGQIVNPGDPLLYIG